MNYPQLIGVNHILLALQETVERVVPLCEQTRYIGIERMPSTVNDWAQVYETVPKESREFYIVADTISHQPMLRIFLEGAPWDEKRTACSIELFWFGVAEALWDHGKRVSGIDHLLRYTTPMRRKVENGKTINEQFDFGFGSTASLEWHFIQGPHYDKYLSRFLPTAGLDAVIMGSMHAISVAASWNTRPILLSTPSGEHMQKSAQVKTLYAESLIPLPEFAENQ